MKKLLTLILVLAMVPVISIAENGLKGYSIEELHILRQMICDEILSRSEWKSVTVRPGFYVIGEDIPAGHWTIRYSDANSYAIVMYFTKTDATGRTPDILSGAFYQANIGGPSNELSSIYNQTEVDLELKNGYFLTIDFSPVIFEPFTGRTSPFFSEVIP